MRLEGWQLIAIIVLAILLFGAPKLPGLARSVGQSLRIFKSEVRQMKDDDPKAPADPMEGRVVNPEQQPKAADQTFFPGQTPPSGTPGGSAGPAGNPPTSR
ncbi:MULTISPECIES: Sec-independent protein translocase subunit TatA [unclassified Arthrobacter]|uniref:Sec-independent protein translocase subunit TatA n=1 Tax=unclassified Arthrobacter TaxID=235627 RepID=UPI001D14259F|nr:MULTISPECIES: Sec-independent protein translocase subunit TatA [unclassified Arthrobacter]MCC3274778.1 Sec-independent protein translocase subunit TatA [Arthrobacter sp. zg-Y20]MCC3279253.1 Sec-independent protein translocase subunit TatA [Arthrobacter sp. zg-Y40]MCC9177629.1 Sec-independent protein translocase subunit TatA [Arthrobacter sp. zg-Y750]MDK1314934.1 Sec-independent protein translocase subunit TatA [Arthrobacter sp. zg.Y20]MDK1327795.1 Sec-independent protein translocase subunit